MTPDQLRTEIIRPVLKKIDLWSEAAEDLLLGTAVHESGGLKRVRQYDGGPALSYFQMEPATLFDLHDHFLKFRPEMREKLDQFQITALLISENLIMNLAYVTAAARLQYYRAPEEIPRGIQGQADYWKKYWNTEQGKGTPEQYITHYKYYV